MNRWNGWGDSSIEYPLPATAAAYIEATVGEKQIIPDALYHDVLACVPSSRLPNYPGFNDDPAIRLAHAHGQSLPDWIALRSGQIDCFPDAVTFPSTIEEVQALIKLASSEKILIIPFGGGTSVVGHVNPLKSEHPILTIDLSRLNRLDNLDEKNQLATFQAGVAGPQIEKMLNERGYTLGHFPQSFEQSTLGGWIATRSSGQQSLYYGRIEELFAGGHLETPCGSIDLPSFPASAAGPDLRQLVLGSEGRFGIITSAIVRIRPNPETDTFYGVFFPDWDSGINALHQISGLKSNVSMLRLSDADETLTTLILSGKDRLVAWAQRGLSVLGYGAGRCMLVFAVTGDHRSARDAFQAVRASTSMNHGLFTGKLIGNMWRKSRFYTPYLRNTLWDYGYALDTVETVLPWTGIQTAANEIKSAIKTSLEPDFEHVLVFAHLSHIYRDGASLYITYLFRRSPDAEETLNRWKTIKAIASQIIIKNHGTISHQHGVGIDHASYLESEKGTLGVAVLESVSKTLDPQHIMNPGKLISG